MPRQQYEVNGIFVPGVTTVLGVLAKPALIQWAHKLGREGVDLNEARDKAMDAGTDAHAVIEAFLRGEYDDVEYYRKTHENFAFYAWQEWRFAESDAREIVGVEEVVISTEHRYGGCFDLVYRDSEGHLWIADWKTTAKTPTVYPEHQYQLAAYAMAWDETHDEKIHGVRVVSLRSTPTKRGRTFLEKRWLSHELAGARRVFLACLEIYRVQQGTEHKREAA